MLLDLSTDAGLYRRALLYVAKQVFSAKRGQKQAKQRNGCLDLGKETELSWNNYWNWTGQLMELDGPANSAT